MNINITFKGLDPSDTLKDYTRDRTGKLEKFLGANAILNAVLAKERESRIAELNFNFRGNNFTASDSTNDMCQSIDGVIDKLISQLKKAKEKRTNKTGTGPKQVWAGMAEEEAEE